jgi:predicted ABC-type ATPase
VLEGGHNIPPSLIEHRHQVSYSYLKSKILEFSEAIIIDVSLELPKQMAVLKLSKIEYEHPEILPWVKQILHIAERLRQKMLESENQKRNIRHKLG